jgi:prepilin-type N-terminal cleavage/methylation domain-containing protein/prepilin-type processing-associated H-X9-DG protein
MTSASPAGRRSGFTLIELLVVIALIAILAAILFPVFARAREQARKTACLSNMKQIGLGLNMYVEDYDEVEPYRENDDSPAPGVSGLPGAETETLSGPYGPTQTVVTTWKSNLQPYIKNYDVFRCPSNQTATVGQNATQWPSGNGVVNPRYAAGYEMYLPNFTNSCCGVAANFFPNGNAWPQPLAGLPYPAQELVIVESHYLWKDIGPWQAYCEPSGPTCDSNSVAGPSSWSSGHAKKASNIVYFDGHAKYRHYPDTFVSDPGRNNENDWRLDYNDIEYGPDHGNFGWLNTAPDEMRSYPNDGGSF